MRFKLDVCTGSEAVQHLVGGSAAPEWRSSRPTNVIRAPRVVDGGATVSSEAVDQLLADITAPESKDQLLLSRDAMLAGRRFLVLDRRFVVWNRLEGQSLRRPEPTLDTLFEVDSAGQCLLRADPADIDVFRGPHLLLHWDASYMYHHWMFECGPRLLRALENPKLRDTKIVLPVDRPSFVDQTLDLLKVPSTRRAFFDPARLTQFEELFLMPVPVFERESCSLLALQTLRAAMLNAVRSEPSGGSKKVYFSRRDAKRSERILLNEEELISVLELNGFTCMETGNLTVEDQIRISRDAEVIACVHGSAGANLLFASAHAIVLHIFPDCVDYFVSHGIGTAVAGCKYGYVFGPSFQRRLRHHNNPWLISPDRVLAALQRLAA